MKGKLQLLRLTLNKTKVIVEKGNLEKIQRHTEALRTIVSAVEGFKIEAEQEKLDGGEQIEDVQKWGEEIEAKTEEADTEILNLQRHLDDAAAKRKTEKKAIEDALVAQRCHEQLQFEKLQLQQTMVVNKPEEKQRVRSPSLTEL